MTELLIPTGVFGSSSGAAFRRGNTVLIFGDSIENQHLTDAAASVNAAAGNGTWNQQGYFHHANLILGHPFSIVSVQGAIGDNTAQYLARLPRVLQSLEPSMPAWCMIGAHDNDAGVAAATSIANLQACYEMLLSAGIQPIARTALPYAGQASYSVTRAAVNHWIKGYAVQRGFPVVDAFMAMNDPANGGNPLATLTRDNLVHPCYNGAALIGKMLAAALAPIVSFTAPLAESADDTANLLPNGGMLIGSQTLAGGLGTGPAGWSFFDSGTGFATWSLVARTDFPGYNWVQCALSSALGSGSSQLYKSISSGWSVGQKIIYKVEFQTDPNTVGSVFTSNPAVGFTGESSFNSCNDVAWSSSANDQVPTSTLDLLPRSGVLVSPEVTIPTETTALVAYLTAGSKLKGNIRFGRSELRVITSNDPTDY